MVLKEGERWLSSPDDFPVHIETTGNIAVSIRPFRTRATPASLREAGLDRLFQHPFRSKR
jgi:hypothetical protein